MKQTSFVKPSAGLYHLYVLQCKDNKWYVGISKKPQERFKKHKSGSGAFFTKKYKPIKIYKTKPLGKMTYDEAEYYENLCTLAWKKAYGIGKVSGGKYVHDKIKRRDLIPVVNEMSDADARKIIMPVHPKEKRIIVRKAKQNYSPDFTKPKLGMKTGTDGLRVLIKKV